MNLRTPITIAGKVEYKVHPKVVELDGDLLKKYKSEQIKKLAGKVSKMRKRKK